ncbi:Uncharacterized protein Adt_45472 [Abeliophyllum distichum]|uniref:Uncharacterized protein n=1 Tax=Abeliophyllum distichum TaxID=126358 RepID=A0ABD1PEH6_9LAMI
MGLSPIPRKCTGKDFASYFESNISLPLLEIRKWENLFTFTKDLFQWEIIPRNSSRFFEGLQQELSRDVQMAGIEGATFATIVDRALTAEQVEQKILRALELQRQTFNDNQDRSWKSKFQKKRSFYTVFTQ